MFRRLSAACAGRISGAPHDRHRRREPTRPSNDHGSNTMSYVIEAEGLTKRFGTTQALAGVDLAVEAGTVLGVLGPNGAGKTTAVRVLATLLRADSGRATVAGYDVATQAQQVRQNVGLT